MGINHTGKRTTFNLAAFGFRQQVFVLGKEDAPQFSRAIKQRVIRSIAPSVLLRSQNIHASQPQTDRDGTTAPHSRQQSLRAQLGDK